MSEKSRSDLEKATNHFHDAEYSIKKAGEKAAQAGDKGTQKKAEELQKTVRETRQDIEKKLAYG